MASINIRRPGWLDRMVEYQKNKFLDDLKKINVVQIKAKMEQAPFGYADSQNWDYESVIRLLTLIRDSDGAKSVREALRRSMQLNRRFMSVVQSLKAFPSLGKEHDNHLYYDMDAGEYYADAKYDTFDERTEEDRIIVVSNPVEARLPSASISVKLLKSILENRAEAGRYIATTKKKIPWSTTSKKSNASGADSSKDAPSVAPTVAPGKLKNIYFPSFFNF
ncbi:uncharacterized protein LOC124541927 isoform X1 [Vanessa cardui]|uniref:uncharacterized protein LOC124541927 isoform X1 n=1 Tax=Vanessa cardui TaxID=171605 RepID=UPI001F13B723|nr:uncharacterized protein LOC124541927 isoform X1 [Vanessa cardui]